MTMTREEAIRNYVEHLIGDDLTYLLQHMSAYDGCFSDYVYYDMDEFDDLMSNYSPMQIAQMIYFGEFNPNDDCFRFDGYGNLESVDWRDVVAEVEDNLIDDIIDHLTHYYSGDTPWPDLDALVDSDDDALFNEDYEEVDEEEEEGEEDQ